MNNLKLVEYSKQVCGPEWDSLSTEQKICLATRIVRAPQDLLGSCLCQSEVDNRIEEDFVSFYGQINLGDTITDLVAYECHEQEVQCCEQCNWWVDAPELDEEGRCADCVRENGEDE